MAGGVRSRRKVRVSDAHGHQENLRSEPLQSVASLTCGDVAAATCLALVAFTVRFNFMQSHGHVGADLRLAFLVLFGAVRKCS
jgi:D-aminopeptidase